MILGVTVRDIEDAIKFLVGNGYNTLCYTIIGLPPMTRESCECTCNFIKWSKENGIYAINATDFKPTPGSSYYDSICKDNHIVKFKTPRNNIPWKNFTFVGNLWNDDIVYCPKSLDNKTFLKYRRKIIDTLIKYDFLREEALGDKR
jgi:radical SAM superfamily enzyme YgiQ (UPF0313 family)